MKLIGTARGNTACLWFGSLGFPEEAAKGNLLGERVCGAPGGGHLGCWD